MNFAVYAPPYDHKYAGVVALYLLNKSLIELGYISKIIEFGNSLNTFEKDSTIVIYPEVIHDNPTGARYVARYMLHKDGAIWGKKIERQKTDFIFTYHKMFEPNAPVLFYPLVDLSKFWFEDDLTSRELNTVYFGKGPPLNLQLDGTVPHLLITRRWPSQKDLLISFFQASRFFHSADCMSTILTEALLCGAAPVIHHWDPLFTRADLLSSELPEAYILQAEQDFSERNVVEKAKMLRTRIEEYQARWLSSVDIMAKKMIEWFA